MIHTKIIPYNEARRQIVRGKGWEHIFSLGKVLRGERSHRSSSTLRSSNATSIRTPETTIFPSAHPKPRRPGKHMGWINIPQKQWARVRAWHLKRLEGPKSTTPDDNPMQSNRRLLSYCMLHASLRPGWGDVNSRYAGRGTRGVPRV